MQISAMDVEFNRTNRPTADVGNRLWRGVMRDLGRTSDVRHFDTTPIGSPTNALSTRNPLLLMVINKRAIENSKVLQ